MAVHTKNQPDKVSALERGSHRYLEWVKEVPGIQAAKADGSKFRPRILTGLKTGEPGAIFPMTGSCPNPLPVSGKYLEEMADVDKKLENRPEPV